jgi:hypothetical protein
MFNAILELHREFYPPAEHEELTRSISPRDCEADDAAAKLQKFQNRTLIISRVTGMVLKRFFPERADTIHFEVFPAPLFGGDGGESNGCQWTLCAPPEWWLKPSEIPGDCLPFNQFKEEDLRTAMRTQFGDEVWLDNAPTRLDLSKIGALVHTSVAKTLVWTYMGHYLAQAHFTQSQSEQQRLHYLKAVLTLGVCAAWIALTWRLRWQAKLKWALVLGSGVGVCWLAHGGGTRLKREQFDDRDRVAAWRLNQVFCHAYRKRREPTALQAARFFLAVAATARK